jgi:hypothetical protein
VKPLTPLGLASLAGVHGGMRWDDLPPSTNVEDRRGLSLRESMRVRSPAAPRIQPEPRYPGDLPSQLGIDAIGRHPGRRRR